MASATPPAVLAVRTTAATILAVTIVVAVLAGTSPLRWPAAVLAATAGTAVPAVRYAAAGAATAPAPGPEEIAARRALTARLRRMRARGHYTAPERLTFDLLRDLAGRAHGR